MRFSACSGKQRLQNQTLLSYLPSSPDTSRAIVAATGQVIDISVPPTTLLYSIDESTNEDDGLSLKTTYEPLQYGPVSPGTMVGTVYRGLTAVQTFVSGENNRFEFTSVGPPSARCVDGYIRSSTGEVLLEWTAPPGSNRCVVSYGYDYSPTATEWKRTVSSNINNGTWLYFELLQPRRMLLTSKNWLIKSFDPVSMVACVEITSRSGTKVLSFTLNPVVYQ